MPTPIDVQLDSAMALAPFTPAEHETFFASIARHRRLASRVALVSTACAALLGWVVALLLAPLLYALIGLLFDVANLAVPTPDLFGSVSKTVSTTIDHADAIPLRRRLYFTLIAALPGLVVMALAWCTLGRFMCKAMDSGTDFPARAVNASVLAEQRFANVVAEMAIAAGLVAPQVLVADNTAVNAAAFGADASHAHIVVTTGLLAQLNREELQGVAAHLVGSIANGDMRIGRRFATTLAMFGLIAKLSSSLADRDAARRFAKLLRHSLKPGRSAAEGKLAMELTNPFEPEKDASAATPADPDKIPWRTWAWMPLAGPLVIGGFFGGMLCTIALGPLLSLTWRQRKYLADATAVQLTRDPDTLGNALEKMRGAPIDGAFGAWIAHLCVVPVGSIGANSVLGGSAVPMSPSLDKRLKALGLIGARTTPRSDPTIPIWVRCILAPVIALVAGLIGAVVFGLLYVSVALSGLFTWMPALLVHVVLR